MENYDMFTPLNIFVSSTPAFRQVFAIFKAAEEKMAPVENTAGLPCCALFHHTQTKWEQTAKKNPPRRIENVESGTRMVPEITNRSVDRSFAVFSGVQPVQAEKD